MTNPFIVEPDYFDRKITRMYFTGYGSQTFVTHGEGAGEQGVWNAAGQVQGLWDAPVKTTWKTGAFQDGSTMKAKKVLHRDLTLGFHITETRNPAQTAEQNESEFRKLFDYEVDQWDDDPEPTTLHVETEQSGERKIDLLLSDTPVFEPELDPIMQQYFNLVLKLRAGQPMWYEDPVIKTAAASSASATLQIEVENPTDQPLRHKWILTRADWQVPDVSWKGARNRRYPGGVYSKRAIPVSVQNGCVISLNRQELMVRDVNYTNMLPTLGGMLFKHVIPPYTPKQTLTISYTNAPAGGAMAKLVQPRLWSRPWGLE
jgi:hypothetical protein